MPVVDSSTAAALLLFAGIGFLVGRRSGGASRSPAGAFDDDGACEGGGTDPDDSWRGEVKMVLLVRQDLKMGKGKIAAQW